MPGFLFKGWEFDLAVRYLRTKRKNGGIAVIAILSYVGVALAVTALIAVMSVMNGFQGEIMGRFLTFNSHADISGPVINDSLNREAMLSRLRAVPGVVDAAPYVESSALAESRLTSAPAFVRGGSGESLRRAGIGRDLIAGSFDAYADDAVLIGEGVAGNLGLRVGDQIVLTVPGGRSADNLAAERRAYTVAGIFSSKVAKIDQTYIYMPLAEAQAFLGRDSKWDMIEIRVRKPYRIESVMPRLQAVAGENAKIENWKHRDSVIWGALKFEAAAMRAILFFVTIIAAMNIVSGIVMLVKNKTRDIAILRTIGAGKASITRIFFLAGALVGAAGTFTGLVVGVAIVTFIYPLQRGLEWLFHFSFAMGDMAYLPASLHVGETLFVVFGAFIATSLCTLIPALSAARLEPVDALRYE
ncbi:ABC transporter permease [Asticcacaulis sp.]|uniref:ABC transporter permease n=1 Tax=Asticcacaulis sp. TaxID=1872648 RepID=UPI002C17097E|nr:ABC transporter permease [Asticcacaulis sp.]HTM79515.1 ABC transporter permease [Asticcacaulis sp.]